MEKFSFNLISADWIPVVRLDGSPALISLREALTRAFAYRRVAASLPHANAALLRLLLAMLHRVFGPVDPQAWQSLWQAETFATDELETYLAQWGPHFDLFAGERPFYQDRHPLVEEKPAQALLQIIGGGDTFTLFDHVLDSDSYLLSPPEAALLLITAQSFSLAGLCHPQLKLVYNDAPCSRAVVFFVEGKNLFETLMFNLVQYNRSTPMPWQGIETDRPNWEAEDPYRPRSLPYGYLDYLTWPNRRISLIPDWQGDRIVVARITTAPGLVLDANIRNPMHHYRIDAGKKAGEQTIRVTRFSEGRALWRDSSALFDLNSQAVDPPQALLWMRTLISAGILPRRRLQLAAYGMCTEPGKQKVNFYRGESFEFDDRLLQEPDLVATLGTALQQAQELRRELWSTLTRLATQMIAFDANQEGGRKPDPKDVQNLVSHWDAEGLYWNALELPFYRFLSRLPEDPAGALLTWQAAERSAVKAAYQQTATGLGASLKAFKAAAAAESWLLYGIKKVLGESPQEG